MFSSAAVDVTPSKILSSAAVDVTPSRIFNSAVVDVTPSKIFNSVAVEVTATSSFILGEVKVLFVRVSTPVIVANPARAYSNIFPHTTTINTHNIWSSIIIKHTSS